MGLPLTKVLVVEDDEDDFLLVRDMFRNQRSYGQKLFYLERAPTYERALELLKVDDWNFFIVDFYLGAEATGNGIDFIEAANCNQVSVPTILLSGRQDMHVCDRMMKMVQRDQIRFLDKEDLNWECLYECICDLLSRAVQVLIVEDDPDDAYLIQSYLEDAGYINFEVDCAFSKDEAIERIRQKDYHAVIIDFHLGTRLGTDLVPYLEEHQEDPLILLCTGRDDLIEHQEAVQMIGHGRCRFVSKAQLNREELVKTLVGTTRLAAWSDRKHGKAGR